LTEAITAGSGSTAGFSGVDGTELRNSRTVQYSVGP